MHSLHTCSKLLKDGSYIFHYEYVICITGICLIKASSTAALNEEYDPEGHDIFFIIMGELLPTD